LYILTINLSVQILKNILKNSYRNWPFWFVLRLLVQSSGGKGKETFLEMSRLKFIIRSLCEYLKKLHICFIRHCYNNLALQSKLWQLLTETLRHGRVYFNMSPLAWTDVCTSSLFEYLVRFSCAACNFFFLFSFCPFTIFLP
jgi:hypothetical protein